MRRVLVYGFLLLLFGTSAVMSVPGLLGQNLKLRVSGIPLYHDIGKYKHGGLLGAAHGYGVELYRDLSGNGYYGLHGFGKYASGIGLYNKLGYGLFGKNGLKHMGLYSGVGSKLFGDYGYYYGLLSGKRGPYGMVTLGGIYGGRGVPYGDFGGGNLAHGFNVAFVPKGHGKSFGYTY